MKERAKTPRRRRAFLLDDLDASGRSETTIEVPLTDLVNSPHALAIHRSAEEYADVVACGEITENE